MTMHSLTYFYAQHLVRKYNIDTSRYKSFFERKQQTNKAKIKMKINSTYKLQLLSSEILISRPKTDNPTFIEIILYPLNMQNLYNEIEFL